jgi:hypothetical protein
MRVVTSTAAILMMAAVPAIAQAPKPDTKPAAPKAAAAKAYKTPKTLWGDPDLSGIFTNNDESGIPLERPSQLTGRNSKTFPIPSWRSSATNAIARRRSARRTWAFCRAAIRCTGSRISARRTAAPG